MIDNTIRFVKKEPKLKKTIIRTLSALSITLALTSCSQTNGDQVGLVIKRGKVTKCVNAGWHTDNLGIGADIVNFPVGLDRTDMTADPKSGDEPGDDSVKTNSSQGIGISWDVTVNYSISRDCKDLTTLYNNRIRSNDDVRKRLIRPAVRSVMRDVVGRTDTREAAITKRGDLQKTISAQLEAKLNLPPFNGAVTLESIELREARIDDAFKAQIEAIAAAENEKIQTRVNGEKNEIAAQAAKTAAIAENQKLIAAAEAQKKVVEIQAAADAAKVVAQAEANAESVRLAGKAQADANKAISESLTPEYADLQKSMAASEALGKANTVYLPSGGSSSKDTTLILDQRK